MLETLSGKVKVIFAGNVRNMMLHANAATLNSPLKLKFRQSTFVFWQKIVWKGPRMNKRGIQGSAPHTLSLYKIK